MHLILEYCRFNAILYGTLSLIRKHKKISMRIKNKKKENKIDFKRKLTDNFVLQLRKRLLFSSLLQLNI